MPRGRRPPAAERALLLADGAMGTMLGLGGADFLVPEELNLRAPERVGEVHAAYVAAGSRVVSTNTFGASPAKLALAGLDDRAGEINVRAASIARSAVGQRALVAGSIGPTGRFLEPLGDLSEDRGARRIHPSGRVACRRAAPTY